MPKYLIRTRRFGQWVNIATWERNPTKKELTKCFGPGRYSIFILTDERIPPFYSHHTHRLIHIEKENE